jgi:5-(carboxyamino)imidazole ribonucleotide mutase
MPWKPSMDWVCRTRRACCPRIEHPTRRQSSREAQRIAGAGGAAHLAGVIAAHTWLPVLGVPIQSKLQGLDSLLSTAQMPGGIPVGTLAIGEAGAKNAGLLAAAILATSDDTVREKLETFRKKQSETVLAAKLPT